MQADTTDELLRLMVDEEPGLRMLAQHYLCEGYVQDDAFLEKLFQGWDTWGAAQAYTEFPMLSFVPIAPDRIEECCRRAADMAANRSLLEPVTRCAGKLLEQVMRLPAAELATHAELIEATKNCSKIFFRVDTDALRDRIELIGADADTLAQRLDHALEMLAQDPNHAAAFKNALHALEALRREHPHYMDLAGVLAHKPPDQGPAAVGFQVTVHSLIHFEQNGLEAMLASHLLDPRESIHSNALEASIRMGTPAAAAAMVHQFHEAETPCRQWIARGLQRVRAHQLAHEIARLRSAIRDPALWLMLLVAEIRQFDHDSLSRITVELAKVQSFSGALIDALSLYARMHSERSGARELQNAFMTYLQRVNQGIQQQLTAQAAELPTSEIEARIKSLRKR